MTPQTSFRDHFIHDKCLAGVRVRDVINDSEETLAAYLAHIKHNQLASQIEVAAAAQAAGIAICLSMGNWCGIVGDCQCVSKHVIHLAKGHYILSKYHIKMPAKSYVHDVDNEQMHQKEGIRDRKRRHDPFDTDESFRNKKRSQCHAGVASG